MFGDILSNIGGGLLDLGFDSIRQGWASDEATHARDWSAQQAGIQRDWQRQMRADQYQTAVEDMKKAGLNPMLAYAQGGAGTLQGAMPQAAMAGPASRGSMFSGTTAAQIRALDAQADKAFAEAEGERRRYPTYDITPSKLAQEIKESEERVRQIDEQIKLIGQQKATSAAEEQQRLVLADKAKAEIPNIRATLKLIQAQTQESLEKAGLSASQAREIMQKIEQNLPALQRALGVMELNERSVGLVGKEVSAAAKDSFLGAFGEYLDHIKPLSSVIGAIAGYGLGRLLPKDKVPSGEGRDRWRNPPKDK